MVAAERARAAGRSGTGSLILGAWCLVSALLALPSAGQAQPTPALPESPSPAIQPAEGMSSARPLSPCPLPALPDLPGCNPGPAEVTARASASAPSASLPSPSTAPGTREERILLPLLLQERALLEDYGPDHPEVCNLRARIETVRDFLLRHPEPALADRPEPARAAPSVARMAPGNITPASLTSPPATETPPACQVPTVVVVNQVPGAPNLSNLPIVPTASTPLEPSLAASTVPAATAGPPAPNPVEEKKVVVPAQPAPPPSDPLPLDRWQLLGMLAAFLVGLLVHIIALFFIIRRNGEREPVYRVELLNAPPHLTSASPSQLATVAEQQGLRLYTDTPEATEAPAASAVEAKPEPEFDLGLTYEEEKRLNEELGRQEEEAMLRHLLEQNVQLRAEIAELPAAD